MFYQLPLLRDASAAIPIASFEIAAIESPHFSTMPCNTAVEIPNRLVTVFTCTGSVKSNMFRWGECLVVSMG